MRLTPLQEQYYPAVRWLMRRPVNGGEAFVGTGRTTLLLYVALKEATENPGMSVPIIDHSSGTIYHIWSSIRHSLAQMCADEEFRDFDFKISDSFRTITAKRRTGK